MYLLYPTVSPMAACQWTLTDGLSVAGLSKAVILRSDHGISVHCVARLGNSASILSAGQVGAGLSVREATYI